MSDFDTLIEEQKQRSKGKDLKELKNGWIHVVYRSRNATNTKRDEFELFVNDLIAKDKQSLAPFGLSDQYVIHLYKRGVDALEELSLLIKVNEVDAKKKKKSASERDPSVFVFKNARPEIRVDVDPLIVGHEIAMKERNNTHEHKFLVSRTGQTFNCIDIIGEGKDMTSNAFATFLLSQDVFKHLVFYVIQQADHIDSDKRCRFLFRVSKQSYKDIKATLKLMTEYDLVWVQKKNKIKNCVGSKSSVLSNFAFDMKRWNQSECVTHIGNISLDKLEKYEKAVGHSFYNIDFKTTEDPRFERFIEWCSSTFGSKIRVLVKNKLHYSCITDQLSEMNFDSLLLDIVNVFPEIFVKRCAMEFDETVDVAEISQQEFDHVQMTNNAAHQNIVFTNNSLMLSVIKSVKNSINKDDLVKKFLKRNDNNGRFIYDDTEETVTMGRIRGHTSDEKKEKTTDDEKKNEIAEELMSFVYSNSLEKNRQYHGQHHIPSNVLFVVYETNGICNVPLEKVKKLVETLGEKAVFVSHVIQENHVFTCVLIKFDLKSVFTNQSILIGDFDITENGSRIVPDIYTLVNWHGLAYHLCNPKYEFDSSFAMEDDPFDDLNVTKIYVTYVAMRREELDAKSIHAQLKEQIGQKYVSGTVFVNPIKRIVKCTLTLSFSDDGKDYMTTIDNMLTVDKNSSCFIVTEKYEAIFRDLQECGRTSLFGTLSTDEFVDLAQRSETEVVKKTNTKLTLTKNSSNEPIDHKEVNDLIKFFDQVEIVDTVSYNDTPPYAYLYINTFESKFVAEVFQGIASRFGFSVSV